MKIPKSNGGPSVPAGFHRANLQALVDLGIQPSVKFAPRHELLLVFELADQTRDDGTPLDVSARVTLSANKKATLRKWLESWRGAPFKSDNEATDLDLATLVGKPVFVQTVQNESGDRVYTNVTNLAPIPAGMEKPVLKGKPIVYDPSREDAEEVRSQLPEWIYKRLQNQIVKDDIVDEGPDLSDVPF